MKQNCTRNFLLAALFLVMSFQGFAQPDYRFVNWTLESGTALQTNAVYRFRHVKPGIDARVTIKGFNNGASLDIFDETGTGFDEAFQPKVRLGARSKNSYAEFQIDFVLHNTILPMPQAIVYLTAIDIDGHIAPGDTLHEFDNINLGVTSIVDFEALLGGLGISNVGLWKMGKNYSGVEYDGIDTLAKNVMYTVQGALVTTIIIRSGGDNSANFTVARQRSLIFERFEYPGSILLPLPKLMSFDGVNRNNAIELNWKFDTKEGLTTCVLERSANGGAYEQVSAFGLLDDRSSNVFSYTDQPPVNGNYTYRLRMIGSKGEVKYSNVLAFTTKQIQHNELKVYPTVVKSTVTLNIHLQANQNTTLMKVADVSGRIVKQQTINLQKGINTIRVDGFDQLQKGNYFIIINTDQEVYSKQIILQ